MIPTMIRSLRCLWLLLAAVLILSPSLGQAVDLPGLAGKQAVTSDKDQKLDSKQLKSSLDDIIHTLKDEQQRAQLLQQLEALRNDLAANPSQASTSQSQEGGLLGAISNSFSDLSKQAETNGAPLPYLQFRAQIAIANLQHLFTRTPPAELIRNILGIVFGLGLWLASILAIGFASRRWFAQLGWPVVLPPAPRIWMLAVHFVRRLAPFLVTFLVLLTCVLLFSIPPPIATAVMVVAYVVLCGNVLATVFEVVTSLFSRGHRQVAVAILHRVAIKRLVVIGALVALGDAVGSRQVVVLLGIELTTDLAVLANALAALLSAILILRVRRPITHLIKNAPLAERRQRSGFQDLIASLAYLWHVPALLLIIASLTAMFVSGGHTHAAFARAMICTVFLVLAIVVAGLLRREYTRGGRRPYLQRNIYAMRLRRLGFTLLHVLIWAVFAELSLRVWGLSLFGLGQQGIASGGIGEALTEFGLTILVAWLAWIVADTAIYRALHGHRQRTNRAQTITPMIRNVVLFTIIVIAVITGLSTLGVDVTPILAGAGIIGIAVGFGAQNLVADLITGIFILIEDSLAVGDFVEINGHMGTVEGLNLRAVWLRDLDAVVHIMTFSKIEAIHNMSRQFGIALIKLRIPYDLPIDDAIELMHRTAADLRKDPFMRGLIRSHLEIQDIHEFDNGCPILRMRMRTTPEYQWNVARAFNLALKRRLEAEHINLGAPRMSVAMETSGSTRYSKSDTATRDQGTTMDWPIDTEASPDAS
jgi:small-conductance mechanosensitive channel